MSDTGKILHTPGTQYPAIKAMLALGKDVSLTGSLRMQVQPALLTAKHEEVKKETGALIDILLRNLDKELAQHSRSVQQSQNRSHTQRVRGTSGQKEFSLVW